MSAFFDNLLALLWNDLTRPRLREASGDGLELGHRIAEERVTSERVVIPHEFRTFQLGVLGRTGSGKSSLIKSAASQDVDIRNDFGWVYFDLHGDADPFLQRVIAAEEQRRHVDLSHKLIRVAPGDTRYSVGLNVLERRPGQNTFVQIAEFTQILKRHWHLDSFGAQTEELLRNCLHVLVDNELTLVELTPLLTNSTFRQNCLSRVENPEIRAYFKARYDAASAAMQSVMRNPILNKISFFTVDPHFRHVVGQRRSTFDLIEAMDRGCWVILNLAKSELGEQSQTLASLILAKLKNGLFARRSRRLFTFYCDELQNLVASESGIETLLSEARKFGVSIVTANQFLEQLSPLMRAALLSVQTHILFRLSSPDAEKLSTALDGGKNLATLLRSLPPRHMVVQSGDTPWRLVLAKTVREPRTDPSELYERSQRRWARRRNDIEQEIRSRQPQPEHGTREALDEWT